MDIYSLSRNFWDYAFENPEKINPNHAAIYFFAIEHCNRLGWKEKFGIPSVMVMEAVGIKSYNTYIKNFNDLIDFGFIKLIEKSKNQYSSNIIAISKNNKATNKALDKALIKHKSKQSKSTIQSNDSIDIQDTIIQDTNLQINKVYLEFDIFVDTKQWIEIWERWKIYKFEQFKDKYKSEDSEITAIKKLIELSKNNFETAEKIINQSIANTWKGLFELKENKPVNVNNANNKHSHLIILNE